MQFTGYFTMLFDLWTIYNIEFDSLMLHMYAECLYFKHVELVVHIYTYPGLVQDWLHPTRMSTNYFVMFVLHKDILCLLYLIKKGPSA